MDLPQFIREQPDETAISFARRLPCSRATLYRITGGKTLGDLETWLAIIRETGGRVTPNDHPEIAAAIKEAHEHGPTAPSPTRGTAAPAGDGGR